MTGRRRLQVAAMAGYCAGPKRSPGATQDLEQGYAPGPTAKAGDWLNARRRPLLEFCAHGRQYAHPVEVSS